MGDFLHGWRRKLGIVTLLLAFVFLSGWIRSRSHCDHVTIRSGQQTVHWLISGYHWLGWVMYREPENTFPPTVKTQWKVWQACETPFSAVHTRWNARFSYFYESTSAAANPHLIVPYAVIVLPLTFLAAYLLLTKSPKSNQKNNVKPNPEAAN